MHASSSMDIQGLDYLPNQFQYIQLLLALMPLDTR